MKVSPNPNEIIINDKPYHLYIIYDHQRRSIYKFGVCGTPLRKNGNSPRMTAQVNSLNQPDKDIAIRYTGRILLEDIKGIIRAYIAEDDMVDFFRLKNNDELPRGNEGHLYLGRKYAYLLLEAGEDL
jgi:hypothetical protein